MIVGTTQAASWCATQSSVGIPLRLSPNSLLRRQATLLRRVFGRTRPVGPTAYARRGVAPQFQRSQLLGLESF